jgi:hypothetical protein
MIRVLPAEGMRILREALARLLRLETDLDVVAEVEHDGARRLLSPGGQVVEARAAPHAGRGFAGRACAVVGDPQPHPAVARPGRHLAGAGRGVAYDVGGGLAQDGGQQRVRLGRQGGQRAHVRRQPDAGGLQ